jgi:Xaa-Pro aminopeptidase
MKHDLDDLMQVENVDAILVMGAGFHNPYMVYLTGGAHLTQALVIKKRGESAVLFHESMERGEAQKTGLLTVNLSGYRINDLVKETGGDHLKAMSMRLEKILREQNLTKGRVALYGNQDAGIAASLVAELRQRLPGLEFFGSSRGGVLMRAMACKDEQELARIQKVGESTARVVGNTADFLSSCRTRNEILENKDGSAVTIGQVKRKINLWLMEEGLENPEGTIFAIGRDSALPHSSGNDSDVLRLGKTIVFDIFPCEAGGGYFHDFSRTWSLGYATDEARELHEQVFDALQRVTHALTVDTPFSAYQKMVCEWFEELGHPTVQTDPAAEEGYVHGLGHGVGLRVHELPFYTPSQGDENMLRPGCVIAIEPGLYYPEREMGVRIENTYWADSCGKFHSFVDYPTDLVLPVKN